MRRLIVSCAVIVGVFAALAVAVDGVWPRALCVAVVASASTIFGMAAQTRTLLTAQRRGILTIRPNGDPQ